MSQANPPGYDEVQAAANRVLDQFAVAFEKWWLRRDKATREKYLAAALEQSGPFGESEAERVRALTRDAVTICHLLDAIRDECGIGADDPTLVRQYRNALSHRAKNAKGEFVFLLPDRAERFVEAAGRMVKSLRSKQEEAKIAQLGEFIRQTLHDGGPPLPPLFADGLPRPPRVEEAPYPLPNVAKSERRPLNPDEQDVEGRLSADQKSAVDRIEKWFRDDGGRPFFALAGAAGSGKTTVTGMVIRRLGLAPQQVVLLAPTGKAVEALKYRLPRGWKGRARTLASYLWNWRFQGYQGEDNQFVNKGRKSVDHGVALLVVDEASMVTKQDFEALQQYRRVLFTGDADQLPPVVEDPALEAELGYCGVLDQPDATLEVIHRHGKDSSIHEVAQTARRGLQPPFGATKDGRVLCVSELDGHFGVDQLYEYVDHADVVLTQRNSVRVTINEFIRRRRGFMKSPIDFVPKVGEILVCSENFMHPETRTRVANGERLVITEVNGTRSVRQDDPEILDYVVVAHPEGRPDVEDEWVISSQMLRGDQIRGLVLATEHVSGPKSNVLRADWGYCLTVHKAQGSEWPKVVVVDDQDPDHNVPLNKWYYVAYSRAVEQLVILRVRRDTMLFAWAG